MPRRKTTKPTTKKRPAIIDDLIESITRGLVSGAVAGVGILLLVGGIKLTLSSFAKSGIGGAYTILGAIGIIFGISFIFSGLSVFQKTGQAQ